MKYEGRLFGKVNKRFIELEMTSKDVVKILEEVSILESDKYHAEANLAIAEKQIKEHDEQYSVWISRLTRENDNLRELIRVVWYGDPSYPEIPIDKLIKDALKDKSDEN